MISWIDKLPDGAVGILLAGTAWFGFNYTVLGERALAQYGTANVVPACIAALHDYEASLPQAINPRIGQLLGVPELDILTDQLVDQMKPRLLTEAEKAARCQCAVASSSASMRFDYALHTATFRAFSPESIASFRSNSVRVVSSGACGPLPQANG